MLVKLDNKKTVIHIYDEVYFDGGYYTIIPFQKYDGLRDEYSLIFQNGLGERFSYAKLYNGEELKEKFGHDIEALLTEE